MIARLEGKLIERRADSAVIDVQGVGYLVSLSHLTLDGLGPEGETVVLQIHTHVREDALQLFGFMDMTEQETFVALIGLNGIGPKAAMGILSSIEPRELARAVGAEDVARLVMIPGVGKKKAERMVLELKDRLGHLVGDEQDSGGTAADMRSALANLGFKSNEIEKTLSQLRKPIAAGTDLDALMPEALRILRG